MITAREVQFFLEDLQEGRYIPAMDFLVDIHDHAKRYAFSERLSKIPDEELIRELLPKHKHGIMKRILRYIKIYDQNEINWFVPKMIAALRHFGIDWPELDTLEQAIKHVTKLDENRRQVTGNWFFDNIKSNLDKPNPTLSDIRSASAHIRLLSVDVDWQIFQQPVLDVLLANQHKLIEFTRKPTSSIYIHTIANFINAGAYWLLPYVDEKKHDIIKWLLEQLKDEHYKYVSNTINLLKDCGLNWLELTLIRKSLDNIKIDESDYVHEHDNVDIAALFSQSQFYYALYYVNRHKMTVSNTKHLRSILVKNRNNIQEFLLYRLEHYDLFEVIRMVDFLQATEIGWQWPTRFLEQHKSEIVKLMLKRIINPNADPELILDLIWILRKNNVNWPELAIVENSLKHGVK